MFRNNQVVFIKAGLNFTELKYSRLSWSIFAFDVRRTQHKLNAQEARARAFKLDIILRNSTPEEFAFSSQINLVGIIAIEREFTFWETFLLLSVSLGLFPEPVVSLGRVERSMFRNSTGDIEKAQFG